jgi:lipopolysaccharide transport system ATP-binding protein
MTQVAIHATELAKRYRIGLVKARYKTLRKAIVETAMAPVNWLKRSRPNSNYSGPGMIWALKDVTFDILKGEAVGLIGRNGAGKSTLLKVLSRITRPTSGRATVYGRVGSLLEVGTGFHPELTGRENIFLNGAILGMQRTEIDRKFDEIVAFSDIEKFLDTPVKFYSSGMYTRLAFSVAAHLETEILLVDEVLAVGDIAFQEKCLGKMGQVSRGGRTVVFVSHNLTSIWTLCRTAIWLDNGTIREFGAVEEVITSYRNSMKAQQRTDLNSLARQGSGHFRFTNFVIEDGNGNACESIPSGQDVTFVLDYQLAPGFQMDDPTIFVVISNSLEMRLISLTNTASGDRLVKLPLRGKLKCFVPHLPLIPGEYNLTFACRVKRELEDELHSAAKLLVVEGDFYGSGRLPPKGLGDVLVKYQWRVEEE